MTKEHGARSPVLGLGGDTPQALRCSAWARGLGLAALFCVAICACAPSAGPAGTRDTAPHGMDASVDGADLHGEADLPVDVSPEADAESGLDLPEDLDVGPDSLSEDAAVDPDSPDSSDLHDSEAAEAAEDAGGPDDRDGGGGDDACDAPSVHGEGEPLAGLNRCGRLSYGLYAARGQEAAVHRLPDFSHAGYRGGGVAIPDVAAVVTVSPGGGDDLGRLQAALDEVGARPRGPDGFRGAVQLERGTYELSDTLVLDRSGVVLRGVGQGRSDTVLRATRRAQHDLIEVRGQGSGLGEIPGSRVRVLDAHVPVGARSFGVTSVEGYRPGAVVGVVRTPNDAWIEALGMGRWGWTAEAFEVAHLRRVVAVEGQRVTVDIPLVDALEERYGGGALFRADLGGRVEGVGVEDLRIVSDFQGADDEEHGWVAVRLRRATDSWVRRVTSVHFGYSTVSIDDESSFNTVEECAMLEPVSQITGGRRYAFNLGDGVGNLFQRCYADQTRHSFVSGARTTGPNVWLDCYAAGALSDDGPHHRWATGLLFDNVQTRYLHVENRKDSGTGHGWSGAQVLFWNGVAEGVRCDAPQTAMNWAVGNVGVMEEGQWAPEEPFGWFESHGVAAEPRSIYLQQLRDRLGPEAVAAVTLPAQADGRIWGRLARWRGEGRLSEVAPPGDPACATGIIAGRVCCAASCGVCGGSGCGGRPGGAEACCSGTVTQSGRSCEQFGPPCLLD